MKPTQPDSPASVAASTPETARAAYQLALEFIAKHRRQIVNRNSPGVGRERRDYAIACLNDLASDIERHALASPVPASGEKWVNPRETKPIPEEHPDGVLVYYLDSKGKGWYGTWTPHAFFYGPETFADAVGWMPLPAAPQEEPAPEMTAKEAEILRWFDEHFPHDEDCNRRVVIRVRKTTKCDCYRAEAEVELKALFARHSDT